MQEIELRFLIPPARLKGLMRQAKVKSSQVTQLAAHYYDTPDQQLAQAGIGLRIRKEGNNCVQTIKARGDGIAARLEHNTTLDHEHVQAMLNDNALMPDLTIYKDTAIAPALAKFKLKKLAKNLTRQYVTDVERTTRLLVDDKNYKNESSIEVAYDHGKIIHGKDDTQRQAIEEIEFELVSGDLDFLFATAKTWCKRYKLCLSTVTKAERGGLLITEQAYSPAVSANLSQLEVHKDSSRPAFVRAVVNNCLLQILPNSSAIAEGSEDDGHILQLRIGIQRLQSALKAFNNFSDQLNPEWSVILKQTATLLDEYREVAYLAHTVQPKLKQQGAPTVDWSAELKNIKVSPIDAVQANDFQLTLLELIAFSMSDPSTEAQADKLAIDKLAKILSKHHTKLLEAEHNLDDLDIDNAGDVSSNSNDEQKAQHKLHNHLNSHLKSLRYISEFAAPLYSKKQSKRWIKRLAKAQKALGQYLDNLNHKDYYLQKSATEPNALYGAGWFSATLVKREKRYQKRLEKARSSTTFW